jgi:exo-beta-1,3-glucanase (GH17 family)
MIEPVRATRARRALRRGCSPFFGIAAVAAVAAVGCSDDTSHPKQAVTGDLFVVEGASGTLTLDASAAPSANADGNVPATLVIEPVAATVTGFRDRPVEEAVTYPIAEFVDGWNSIGGGVFPPAASLTVRSETGDASVAVITLSDPTYDADTKRLVFDAMVPGNLNFPSSFLDPDVFIDTLQPSQNGWTSLAFSLPGGAGTLTKEGDGSFALEFQSSDDATYFSGAPAFRAGTMLTSELVDGWETFGFDKVRPNASVSVRTAAPADQPLVAVFELKKPIYDASTGVIRFNAETILNSHLIPEDFAQTDLFIDSGQFALGFGADYSANHYATPSRNDATPWSDIDDDFQVLKSHFDTVRTYSLDQFDSTRILSAARRYHLGVALGVGWAYANTAANDLQFDQFTSIFTTYPHLQDVVKVIIVGNEACNTTAGAPGEWVKYYAKVLNWVNNNANWGNPKPIVTMSERWGVWLATGATDCGVILRAGIASGTPIFANIYPFWGDCDISDATATTSSSACDSLQQRWTKITSTLSAKHPIIIGETGWPTGGQPGTGKSPTVVPTLKDSLTYWAYVYNKFVPNNAATAPTVFAFEAFDEPLKAPEGGSPDLSHHWGLLTDLRVVKKDSTASMTFPQTRSVTPAAATGAYIQMVLTGGGTYEPVKTQITLNDGTSGKTYSYDEWFVSASAGYPWLTYNSTATVHLPAVGAAPAADCTNTLTGGHGIATWTLTWGTAAPATSPCDQITWSPDGIFLPASP